MKPIKTLPPLHALRAFEACARLLSFSKAADELGVTPGAISQQIRTLESHVGAPLFKRIGRGVVLTDPARNAAPMINEAFQKLSEAGHVLRQPARKGRIAISCAPSFAAKWLAPRLDRFQDEEPDVEVWIASDMRLVDFSTSETDLAIRYGSGSYDGLRAEKLLEESVLPVCAPDLIDGANRLRKPGDLAKAVLIHDESPDNDPSCPTWPMWLASRGLEFESARKGPRFNQSALALEATLAGRGVALAKRAIAQTDLDRGRLVAPFADGSASVDFAYWIVWPKGRHLRPEVRAFMAWVKREAQASEVSGV